MTLPSPWDEIEIEDLPEGPLREIAQKHGLAVARDIWREFGGSTIDLPKRLPRGFAVRYIGRYWNGKNNAALARRLDVTKRTVYEYLSHGSQRPMRAPAPRPSPGQLSLLP